MKREPLTGFQCVTPSHVVVALVWCTVLAPIGLLVALAWIAQWFDAATKGQIKQSMIEKSNSAMKQSDNVLLGLARQLVAVFRRTGFQPVNE